MSPDLADQRSVLLRLDATPLARISAVSTEIDLLHPSSRQDPYPAYHALREADPVHWNARLGMWVVTRYGDVEHVLTSRTGFSVERFRGLGERPDTAALAGVLRHWTVYRDPPDHTRLRGLLSLGFTPRRLQDLRGRIQAIVDDLLDDAAARGTVDFISAFAFPLPATVIALMLGVPVGDLDPIKTWSNQIAAFIGGARSGADAESAGQGLLHAQAYFRDLVRERRTADVRGDVLGGLLAAERDGERLSEDEVVANCVLLVFAGHETTTNLLGNGLYHLLRHPAEEATLRARPGLVPSAIEEFLRYDAPVAGTIRIVTEDVELAGRTLRPGDAVAAMLASANRDPRRIARPDDLDVTRTPNRHLAFGAATHFCLGAALARLEAQITFDTLLRRFRRISLVDELARWKPQVFFRELKSLPVSLAA